jgi:hypothetical protein
MDRSWSLYVCVEKERVYRCCRTRKRGLPADARNFRRLGAFFMDEEEGEEEEEEQEQEEEEEEEEEEDFIHNLNCLRGFSTSS